MLNSFRPRSNCEIEARFIQDRIQSVEKNVAEFCNTFAQYSRKTSQVRDKGDEIAKIALTYAESEFINKSLAMGLENFGDSMLTIGDYGDNRAQILDAKVVSEFARYEDICKHAREEVKEIYAARDKEVNRKKQLDRVRERDPRNRQQIIQAETELVKATAEVSKSIHNLEDKTNSFERQKLHDIKSILQDFISIEMGYHAKALEVLTKAYNDVDSINEEADLQDFQKIRGKVQSEFKKSLRTPSTTQHQSPGQKPNLFNSRGSLGSLGAIFSTTHNKRTPGIPDSKQKSQHSKSEETLDSMKQAISDSEESENDSEANSEDDTSSDVEVSPNTIKK